MAETKEERRARIEKEVAERSAARTQLYFENAERARQAAAAQAPTLAAPDAYNYNYAWRSDVGSRSTGVSGSLNLVKTPNAYYDVSTNEIVNPATGERTPAIQSMWSGPTSFAGSSSGSAFGANISTANLTPEQIAARNNAAAVAAQLGLSIDPKTGLIIKPPVGFVINPATGKFVDPKTLSKPGKTETRRVTNSDGSTTIFYSDGTSVNIPATTLTGSGTTFDIAANFAAQQAAQLAAEEKRRQGQSAYSLLFSEFERYGLGALVEPLKGFIVEGLSPAEFTLRLRETDAYKKRFAANQARIQKGLRALSEAEYIGLEDQYQDVMRRYGLPENYYSRGDMGRQEGFERFIGGDVSPVELEDRIQTAQRRVINAAPEVTASLRSFYPEIGQGDLLAYFLDPDKAIENIKRKVTAAEIGGAATMAGLATGATRAEELARYGVTGEAARQGFQTIAEVLPRGSQLAEIYKQSPYTQTTAEQEVFGLAGATEASKRRRQLTQLEQASFSGSSGVAGGALGRERAGAI